MPLIRRRCVACGSMRASSRQGTNVSEARTADSRAVRKAWSRLPLGTRDVVLKAALKGERPDSDAQTLETARAWAHLYPSRSVPGTLLSLALLILAIGYPEIWGPFVWFVIGLAVISLASSAYLNVLTAKVRRVLDDGDQAGSPSAPSAP